MRPASSSSSSAGGGGKRTARVLTIGSTGHPWTPEREDGRSPCVPWGETLYVWIPFENAFMSMATAFAHTESRPDMRLIVQNVQETMDLVGSIAAVMANYNVAHSSNAMRTGPAQLNTMTVVFGKADKADKPIGIIWALFSAYHPVDDADVDGRKDAADIVRARNENRSPCHILQKQIHAHGASSTDGITGISDGKRRAPARPAKGDVATFFQSVTLHTYRKMVDAYVPYVEGDVYRALDPMNPDSSYNLRKAFSLRNACLKAHRAGAHHDFVEQTMWEVPHGGAGGVDGTAFRRPREGKTTFLLAGAELAPHNLRCAFFPHVKPLAPDEANPGVRALIDGFYDGRRHADSTHDLRNAEDAARYDIARQRAIDQCLASGAGIDAGFTLDSFVRAAQDSRKKLFSTYQDDARKRLAVRDPDVTPSSIAGMREVWVEYRDQSVALRVWENEWLARMWTVVHPGGDISDSEKAVARELNELLSTAGTLSMPYTNPWKNLTPFGNVIANKFLSHEQYFTTHVTHAASIILEIAAFSVWTKGPLKFNVFGYGEASTGKSRIAEQLFKKCIPDTAKNSSGSSEKAELVEGASAMIDKTVVIYGETPPTLIDIGGSSGRIAEKGKATAGTQGNTDRAAMWRDICAAGEVKYYRYAKDADGRDYMNEISIKAERAFVLLSNSDFATDLPRNSQERLYPLNISGGKRPDISFAHSASRAPSESQKRGESAYIKRFRRDQVVMYIIYVCQLAGILPEWTTTATESMTVSILEMASRKGLASAMDPRTMLRLRKAVIVAATWDVIYRYLDSDMRVIGKVWNWSDFLQIRVGLVTTPEHLVYAMSIMSNEWVNPGIAEVVAGIEHHFRLGPAAGQECVPQMRGEDARAFLGEPVGAAAPRGRPFGTHKPVVARARAREAAAIGAVPFEESTFSAAFGARRGGAGAGATMYMPDARIGEGTDPHEFFYFEWSDRGVQEPLSNNHRARKFAREIENSVRTRMPVERLYAIVVSWLDSRVPVPDPLIPGSTECAAFCFETRGAACERLRVHRSFLSAQRESVVVHCMRSLLDRHGFEDVPYVTGSPTTTPYVCRLIHRTPLERRKPFIFLNLAMTNPYTDAVLEAMVKSADAVGAIDKEADREASSSLVEQRMLSLRRSAPWVAVHRPEQEIMLLAIEEHFIGARIVDALDFPHEIREMVYHSRVLYTLQEGYTYPRDVMFSFNSDEESATMKATRFPRKYSVAGAIEKRRFLRSEQKLMAEQGLAEWYYSPKAAEVPPGGAEPRWGTLGGIEDAKEEKELARDAAQQKALGVFWIPGTDGRSRYLAEERADLVERGVAVPGGAAADCASDGDDDGESKEERGSASGARATAAKRLVQEGLAEAGALLRSQSLPVFHAQPPSDDDDDDNPRSAPGAWAFTLRGHEPRAPTKRRAVADIDDNSDSDAFAARRVRPRPDPPAVAAVAADSLADELF